MTGTFSTEHKLCNNLTSLEGRIELGNSDPQHSHPFCAAGATTRMFLFVEVVASAIPTAAGARIARG
jgi:hypothetical protein